MVSPNNSKYSMFVIKIFKYCLFSYFLIFLIDDYNVYFESDLLLCMCIGVPVYTYTSSIELLNIYFSFIAIYVLKMSFYVYFINILT
jgi:hypothetical protein